MALSFKMLGRPFSNYVSLFLKQQRITNTFRGASTSCFLCGSSPAFNFAAGFLNTHTLHKGLISLRQTSAAIKNFSTTPARNDAALGEDKSTQDEKIYSGGLTSQIRALKIFSLSTSAIGLGVQPLLWTQFADKFGSGSTYAIFSIMAFFTAVTPVLIHYVAKKYVTELYYNKHTQTYKAITFSFLLGRVETIFKQEDVERPDMLGMFETFRVNKKSFFVDPSSFPSSVDYVKLKGFDKPMDFTYFEDKEKQQKK